ncbi:MAG: hypothetical protein KZQ85_10965 [Candidatus Thiodiazotropha sp. (ex Myrtea sp. 'scaly one' KF741663)]|nr:hypothetical protein [Candidatus Thiodiazotropha sp. (ex Myrtea sp. 'scaly one' KF741663)]
MIRIAGMNGWAKVGYGGTSYSDMHDRQVSMLLAADMGGKPVRLEFEDSSLICSDSHDGVLIRYVQLEN